MLCILLPIPDFLEIHIQQLAFSEATFQTRDTGQSYWPDFKLQE
jgi:hypothetical protein